MSFLNVFNKLRLISHQLVHQSRSLAFQVHVPKNFVSELQAPRIFSCQTFLDNGGAKKVNVPEDGTVARLLVSPTPCADDLSKRLQQLLVPGLGPYPEAGDFTLILKSGGECKPKCPKKKKKSKCKKKKKKKKDKCKKKKKPKKNKCKKKKKKPKKNKCKKKKKPKKKSKCKKKKAKKPKKKKKCPKKPKCKKKPKCIPKKECKKKPKCEKPKCPPRPKCNPKK